MVDSAGQPTKKVHAFGPKWQALYAPDYDSVVFQNPALKCAASSPCVFRRCASNAHPPVPATQVMVVHDPSGTSDSVDVCRMATEAVKGAWGSVFGSKS